MQFFRMLVLLVLTETVLYFMISLYIRSLRRERLENEFKERFPAMANDREKMNEAVRKGMFGFNKTLRSRLVALVFIIPTVIILLIIVNVN